MIGKETYWSKFATDFEERNNYVIGKVDLQVMQDKLSEQKDLKNTLELGCGDGIFSKNIAKNASQLLATDFSYEMVNASKVRLKSIPNITVRRANCFDLPNLDSSFNTIFMANLLHIIPFPEKAIEEAKRVLRKDGRLIIMSYTTDSMKIPHIIGMTYRYLKTYGMPSPTAKQVSLTEACNILLKSGFSIIQSELIGSKMKAIFIIANKK